MYSNKQCRTYTSTQWRNSEQNISTEKATCIYNSKRYFRTSIDRWNIHVIYILHTPNISWISNHAYKCIILSKSHLPLKIHLRSLFQTPSVWQINNPDPCFSNPSKHVTCILLVIPIPSPSWTFSREYSSFMGTPQSEGHMDILCITKHLMTVVL